MKSLDELVKGNIYGASVDRWPVCCEQFIYLGHTLSISDNIMHLYYISIPNNTMECNVVRINEFLEEVIELDQEKYHYKIQFAKFMLL
jgi:hypothetical protein